MDREHKPHNSTPLVEAAGVSITLRGQAVLRDIDFVVRPGETVALIGESGCGKTVLLKTLIGLVRPTRGVVRFDGHDLSKLSDQRLTQQRTRIGFLFQSAALFDSMTVGQNVAFPLRQHGGYSTQQIREVVLKRLSEVGLPQSVVSKKPAELSGGMRKRVGLARALAMKPELMMYDEPTTGLDPIMSDVINQLIMRTRELHDVTSIVVTHDMTTVRKVASRVVMMLPTSLLQEGESQVIFDGPPDAMNDYADQRVGQFVRGEAGQRLLQLQEGA